MISHRDFIIIIIIKFYFLSIYFVVYFFFRILYLYKIKYSVFQSSSSITGSIINVGWYSPTWTEH